MDKVKVAQELADMGREDAQAVATLQRNAKRRCALLKRIAQHDGTPGVVTASAAPKNEPPTRA